MIKVHGNFIFHICNAFSSFAFTADNQNVWVLCENCPSLTKLFHSFHVKMIGFGATRWVLFLQKLILLKFWTACVVGFLTSSLTTRLYHKRVPRLRSDNFKCCHMRQSGETITSVSAIQNILTDLTNRELGDHDFCLSHSDYTDTDPTSRERGDHGFCISFLCQ